MIFRVFFRLAGIFFLAAFGAAGASAAGESAIEQILARGKIRVGMSSFTPWVMRAKNGDIIGFEPDVARELAKDMGVKAELVPTAWDGIIPALLGGKFDVIIGGMRITPKRNLKINFTRPYADTGHNIFAGRAKAAGFSSLADFNKPEVVIAMRRGISAVDIVKRIMPQAVVRQFDDEVTVIREVINGNAHGSVTAEPTPTFAALDYPDDIFLPLAETFENYSAGFGVRKGDADALNFLNNWILLKRQSGWLQTRHDYWFKSREWATLVGE